MFRQLTYIQDSVPRSVPPPSLQLLVLHILQPAFMEHHAHDALWTGRIRRLGRSAATAGAEQLAQSRTAGLSGKVRKGSPHLFIKANWGTLIGQRWRRWKFSEFPLHSYPSYTRQTYASANIHEVNYPVPMSDCVTQHQQLHSQFKNLKIPWNGHLSFSGNC